MEQCPFAFTTDKINKAGLTTDSPGTLLFVSLVLGLLIQALCHNFGTAA